MLEHGRDAIRVRLISICMDLPAYSVSSMDSVISLANQLCNSLYMTYLYTKFMESSFQLESMISALSVYPLLGIMACVSRGRASSMPLQAIRIFTNMRYLFFTRLILP